MRELVAGDVDLRVDRLAGADRQDFGLRIARAAVPGRKRPVHDPVAKLTGELLQRLPCPGKAVALDLSDRQRQRRGLHGWWQRLDLGLREDRLKPEVGPW